jgi:hypothetical protein
MASSLSPRLLIHPHRKAVGMNEQFSKTDARLCIDLLKREGMKG